MNKKAMDKLTADWQDGYQFGRSEMEAERDALRARVEKLKRALKCISDKPCVRGEHKWCSCFVSIENIAKDALSEGGSK